MVPMENSGARGKMIKEKILKTNISCQNPFKAVNISINVGPKLQILCYDPQSSFPHRANRRWFFHFDVIAGLVDYHLSS
jgi:hypothetical protein